MEKIYTGISPLQIVVEDITNISQSVLEDLDVGDIVAKLTNGDKHCYRVSYKKKGVGMCLTYADASRVETISYDCIEGVWTYNSTDVSELSGNGYQIITIDTSNVDEDGYLIIDTESSRRLLEILKTPIEKSKPVFLVDTHTGSKFSGFTTRYNNSMWLSYFLGDDSALGQYEVLGLELEDNKIYVHRQEL